MNQLFIDKEHHHLRSGITGGLRDGTNRQVFYEYGNVKMAALIIWERPRKVY